MPTHLVVSFLTLVSLSLSCLGQAFTERDPAFMGNVDRTVIVTGPTNITTGLVSYWKCNDGSGLSAADSSGNGLVLSLSGDNLWDKTNGSPNTTCITFGTSNSRGQSPNNASFNLYTNPFSISFWFQHTNAWSSGSEVFAANADSSSYLIRYEPSVQNHIVLLLNGGDYVLKGPTSVDLGGANTGWNMLTVTHTNNIYSMYLNASQFCLSNNPINPASTTVQKFLVGNESPGQYTRNLRGRMEEVRVYNGYCLTSNDVYYLYHTYYGQP